MTASRYVTIWCDERDWSSLDNPGCGKFIGEGEHTAADARRVARHYGWQVGLPGGIDYCPAHRTTPSRPVVPTHPVQDGE